MDTWCPYCSSPPKLLCNNDDCSQCFEKSFASHDKAKYWSSKNELKQRQVFKSSSNKYLFNCECGHEISITTGNVNSGFWCVYCANHKLCDLDNCNICFEKSFASHEKSKYWSIENKIEPRRLLKCSNNKYKFNCNKCNHLIEISLSAITYDKWCQYCANCILCNNDCNICFNKSFFLVL